MSTIKCPNCGKPIEIDEALKNELRLENKEELERQLRAEIKEENKIELDDLKRTISEKEQKIVDLRNQELSLREEKRKIEEREKELNLEVGRRIDEERKKVEEATLRRAEEEHRLKEAEKDKTIADLTRDIEELKRKAQLGSQQTQGEVQELDLQDNLRKLFLTDSIIEIKKGESGADVKQIVKTQRGTVCGVILWESKRTKAWSDGWIVKLKEDLRRDSAHLGVIISGVLPPDLKKEIGEKEGIWITTPVFLEPLANLLRKNLYDVAKEKAITINKQSKAEELYDFITSHEFSQQVESMVGIYLTMMNQIAKERASAERQWKEREMQIDRLLGGVSGIYGSLQGIAGSALPQIKLLESGIETETP